MEPNQCDIESSVYREDEQIHELVTRNVGE